MGFAEKGVCVCARLLACLNFLLGYTFSQASALAEGWALSLGPPPPHPIPQLEVFTDLHLSSPAPIGEADYLPGLFQMYVCQRPPPV